MVMSRFWVHFHCTDNLPSSSWNFRFYFQFQSTCTTALFITGSMEYALKTFPSCAAYAVTLCLDEHGLNMPQLLVGSCLTHMSSDHLMWLLDSTKSKNYIWWLPWLMHTVEYYALMSICFFITLKSTSWLCRNQIGTVFKIPDSVFKKKYIRFIHIFHNYMKLPKMGSS